ncbi:MAG: HlyD family secretion protein [Bacteroidia bacterium]
MTETATTETKKKSQVPRIIAAALFIGAAIYGFIKFEYNLSHETTDNAQIETHIMPVIARVSGYVDKVNIHDYDTVSKGAVLVVIDSSEFALALNEMNADYNQALADLENAKANIENARLATNVSGSTVELMQVKLNKAKSDYERDQNLFKDNAITSKQLDDSKANYETLQKQIVTSNDDKSVTNSRIAIAEAGARKAEAVVELKKSRIDQQKLKLSYTKLIAPVAGKVSKKNIEPGQFVQAGQTLFSIVSDSDYWIVANFKETQLEHMKIGQEVNIKIDSYPDLDIKGKVVSMSDATGAKFSLLPADNSTGNFVKVTQRVPVKIEIINLQEYKNILKAGLSLDVAVSTK